MTLNYIEHFLTLVFGVCMYVCISIARIKKYKSTIKKKKKKHDEIGKILLAKINLDCIKGSTSSFLTNSYNERDYFLLINVLKEYDNVKEKINKLQSS